MHELLRDISCRDAWYSGTVRSIFFEERDVDTSPKIQEIASRVIAWLGEHSSELGESDSPSLFKLSQVFDTFHLSSDPLILLASSIKFKSTPPLHPARADTIEHSFDRVTRYLPDRDTLVFQSLDRKRQIRMLINLLKDGAWDEIVKYYEGDSWYLLAHDGLGAFQKGKITTEQFSTLIFRWSLAKDFPDVKIETISLFNSDGSINEEAKIHIKQTIKIKELISFEIQSADTVSDADLDAFYLRMKRAPKSEQYFFQFPTAPISKYDPYSHEAEFKARTRTITQEVQALGMNIFNAFVLSQDNWRRMSPSLSMMQQILIAFKGDTAVKIVPVIGLSTVEDIVENGLFGTREMALPFPTISLPKTADSVLAPTDLDFWNHDFYHAFVASHVPDHARRTYIQLAQIVKEFSASITDPQSQDFFSEFFERIIDMEANGYRDNSSKETAFISTLILHMRSTFSRINSRLGGPIGDPGIAERSLPKLNPLFQKLAVRLNQLNFCTAANINSHALAIFQDALCSNIAAVNAELSSIRRQRLLLPPYERKKFQVGIDQCELLRHFITSLKAE